MGRHPVTAGESDGEPVDHQRESEHPHTRLAGPRGDAHEHGATDSGQENDSDGHVAEAVGQPAQLRGAGQRQRVAEERPPERDHGHRPRGERAEDDPTPTAADTEGEHQRDRHELRPQPRDRHRCGRDPPDRMRAPGGTSDGGEREGGQAGLETGATPEAEGPLHDHQEQHRSPLGLVPNGQRHGERGAREAQGTLHVQRVQTERGARAHRQQPQRTGHPVARDARVHRPALAAGQMTRVASDDEGVVDEVAPGEHPDADHRERREQRRPAFERTVPGRGPVRQKQTRLRPSRLAA